MTPLDSAATGPLSVSELLDRMFSIYRRHFLVLVGASALPFLVMVIMGVFFGVGLLALTRGDVLSVFTSGAAVFGIVLLVVAYLLATAVSWMAVTSAVWEVQMGRTPTVRGAYKAAWEKFGTSVLAGFLFGLVVGVGFLLLVVPGIMFELGFCLIGPLMLVEACPATAALSRSWDLTRGYRGKIFLIAIICILIAAVMSSACQLPFQAVSGFVYHGDPGPVWFIVLSTLASLLGSILPAPLQTAALCLVYYDARVRKEGFDLQRLIEELPALSSAASPAPTAG
jgi:hypothetical protein